MDKTWRFVIAAIALGVAQLACVQDCIGNDFRVSGIVQDTESDPIQGATVHTYGDDSFEKPGFDFVLITDESGVFVSEELFRYGCSKFTLEVSADGYGKKTFEYYPPNPDYNEPQLPDPLIITLGRIN